MWLGNNIISKNNRITVSKYIGEPLSGDSTLYRVLSFSLPTARPLQCIADASPVCRAQWQRPSSLTSPTDEDATEAAPETDGAEAEADAMSEQGSVLARPLDTEPMQPTGIASY